MKWFFLTPFFGHCFLVKQDFPTTRDRPQNKEPKSDWKEPLKKCSKQADLTNTNQNWSNAQENIRVQGLQIFTLPSLLGIDHDQTLVTQDKIWSSEPCHLNTNIKFDMKYSLPLRWNNYYLSRLSYALHRNITLAAYLT